MYQWQLFTVDQIGYVALVSGNAFDNTVVEAARFCYQSKGDNMGPKDRNLLEKLVKSDPAHNTVFEHCTFQFEVKCPIFIARQWMRHRIGTFNEKSLRYTKTTPEYWVPPHFGLDERKAYNTTIGYCFQLYQDMLIGGVPKEEARAVLPLATYTQFLWTVNAWSLMNYLSKRLDNHAQRLHREYANLVFRLFKSDMPLTAKFFTERNQACTQ